MVFWCLASYFSLIFGIPASFSIFLHTVNALFLEETSGWDGVIFPQPKCGTIFCIAAYDRIYDRAPSSDVINFRD